MPRHRLFRALGLVLRPDPPAVRRVPPPCSVPPPPGPAALCGHRWMGTHGRKEPREPLNSPPRAKEFIYRLQPAERSSLLQELQNFQSRATAQETLDTGPPTAAQIKHVLLHNAVPFVGFGFLDNAIMIAAGTQIELSIGVTLGISTMAGENENLCFLHGLWCVCVCQIL
ncbi:transmembrane protein 65, partial [Cynoglossus semilaevis]|uniref:transmembrane protein 65 n=1 Tax=Cynoglossus semilaevis TaxID=244447 RepID=UPI000D62BB75